ncbi:carbohydrate ABC transporter permease [Paenibacillus sp. MBLB4367]|uniref:carbohydrate ABC transporter permease n=1 Tax=Paenibacillus sp. MBLB4367 TaxID=3384767 RepID=UPI003907FE5A
MAQPEWNASAAARKGGLFSKGKVRKRIFILLAVGPSFLGYLLFTLYPNIMSVYYSLLEWNGLSSAKFVGIDNYTYMLKDNFVWRALSHNLILMLTIPLLTVYISVFLAYLLNNKGYREAPFYKVLFFLPNVLAIVVVALLWRFIYDGEYGMLNAVLKMFDIDANNFYWLGDKKTALWALLPPAIWGAVGFYIIIFMNAMKSIPASLYESAILDGAGHITRLFKITMPLINPVIRVSALFLVLATFKGFELMLIMTNGGPAGATDVIGLYMFHMAFGKDSHNYGYASAIGMFLFVIMVAAKLIIDKISPKEQIEF